MDPFHGLRHRREMNSELSLLFGEGRFQEADLRAGLTVGKGYGKLVEARAQAVMR